MKRCRITELIDYCIKSNLQIRVIVVKNPSVIVTFKESNYIVYKAIGQGGKRYILAKGEDRVYFDKPEELKKILGM